MFEKPALTKIVILSSKLDMVNPTSSHTDKIHYQRFVKRVYTLRGIYGWHEKRFIILNHQGKAYLYQMKYNYTEIRTAVIKNRGEKK